MKQTIARALVPTSFAALLVGALVFGRQDPDSIQVVTHAVAGTVSYFETGRGGNVGVSVGEDGVLLVDDQFLAFAPKFEAALDELTEDEVVFLVNTHWHGDHTGGNPHFGKSATILAHTNVRRRLAGDPSIGGNTGDMGPPGLPVVTFDDGVSLHFNGEEIRLIHFPNAHTDGDTVVWFTGSNVVHMGDLYFQSGYPFFDLDSGSDPEGLLAAVDRVIELVPEDARFISGHGTATGLDGLREYRAMVRTVLDRVKEAHGEGKDAAAMLADGLLDDLNERWGGGFMTPDRILGILTRWLDSGGR